MCSEFFSCAGTLLVTPAAVNGLQRTRHRAYTVDQASCGLARLRLGRNDRTAARNDTYDWTADSQHVAIFDTRVHDRFPRPVRAVLTTIDHHVRSYKTEQARGGTTARNSRRTPEFGTRSFASAAGVIGAPRDVRCGCEGRCSQ